jgi:hypothetical protein
LAESCETEISGARNRITSQDEREDVGFDMNATNEDGQQN